MRRTLPREFYIPKHSTKVCAKNSSAVVYISDSPICTAVGFFGKASAPSFNYSFRSPEKRAKYVAEWFDSMAAVEASRAKRKAERYAFRHTLKVGDILSSSWGYDQTNTEFWQVTALIGDVMVELREIAQEREDTGYLCGRCTPVPGSFIGKPLRKRVQEGNNVRVHSCALAHPVTTHEVAGVKVADSHYWSSYA